MRRWYLDNCDGQRFKMWISASEAARRNLEPCDPPEDLPERAGAMDAQLEMGYSILDELPVSYRLAREVREREAR